MKRAKLKLLIIHWPFISEWIVVLKVFVTVITFDSNPLEEGIIEGDNPVFDWKIDCNMW